MISSSIAIIKYTLQNVIEVYITEVLCIDNQKYTKIQYIPNISHKIHLHSPVVFRSKKHGP